MTGRVDDGAEMLGGGRDEENWSGGMRRIGRVGLTWGAWNCEGWGEGCVRRRWSMAS